MDPKVELLKNKAKKWVQKGNYLNVAYSLLKNGQLKNGMNILDIGPGEGYLLNKIYSNYGGDIKYNAIDRHKKVLSKLPKGSSFVSVDLMSISDYSKGVKKLPVKSGLYDLIILTEVIEHIAFPQIFISEITRLLKEDGKLLLTTPNIHMFGNRIATLFGVDRIFHNVGSEGFITKIDFDQYGHVAHYSRDSITGMLDPFFEIIEMKAAGFKVPMLRYFQPILIKLFPSLSSNIVLLAKKKSGNLSVFTYDCPLIGDKQIILPDDRCVLVQVHSKTCEQCRYYHKDFISSLDKRKRSGYKPEFE